MHIRGWTSHRVKCVCSPAGSWIFSRVSERMLHIHSLVFSTHIYSINSGAMDETSLQQISAQACELDVCEQVCVLLQYNSVTLESLSISIVPCLFRFHHLLNYKKQKSEYVTKMGVFIAPLCFLLWRMVMRLQVTYAVCIRRCCFIFRDLSINEFNTNRCSSSVCLQKLSQTWLMGKWVCKKICFPPGDSWAGLRCDPDKASGSPAHVPQV